jgi:hypothetical protein
MKVMSMLSLGIARRLDNAVNNGSVKVTKLLLSAGASIYRISRHGEAAFAHVVWCEDTTLLNFPLGG